MNTQHRQHRLFLHHVAKSLSPDDAAVMMTIADTFPPPPSAAPGTGPTFNSAPVEEHPVNGPLLGSEQLQVLAETAGQHPWSAFYKNKYQEWHVSVPVPGSSMGYDLFPDGVPGPHPEQTARLIGSLHQLIETCRVQERALAALGVTDLSPYREPQ